MNYEYGAECAGPGMVTVAWRRMTQEWKEKGYKWVPGVTIYSPGEDHTPPQAIHVYSIEGLKTLRRAIDQALLGEE